MVNRVRGEGVKSEGGSVSEAVAELGPNEKLTTGLSGETVHLRQSH